MIDDTPVEPEPAQPVTEPEMVQCPNCGHGFFDGKPETCPFCRTVL